MIPVFEPVFDKQDIQYVTDAVKSGWLNEHKYTKELEFGLRETITKDDSSTVSMVNNGTSAIFCALRCLNVGRGKRVLVPDYTAIGVVNAVKLCGAYPVLHDVSEDTGNLELTELPKVDAVIAVHNNGYDCDVAKIREHYPDTPIIEDISQALGAQYKGQKQVMGTMGDITVGSLATSKIITMGQGGFVMTNNEADARVVKALKDQGRIEKGDVYQFEGYNFKVTEMQSALGVSQLTKLGDRIRKMKRIFGYYRKCLDLPKMYAGYLPWRVIVKHKGVANKVFKYHQAFTPLHLQPNIQPFLSNTPKFNGSWKYSKSHIYLPSSSNITKKQVDEVCKILVEENKDNE